MSFKFPYKHPLCILIFMYSIYKSLSQGSGNDLKLDLSDFKSIQNFINDKKLAEGANTNTNKLCIPSNLVFQMNNRTNVISPEKNGTNPRCIEYDNGDNSYIKNPELRYNKDKLESKKKEWIEQMNKEYIQSKDNKCAIYSGKECIYINGTKENQLKLPLRSLQGYCRGGKPIRWYENTTIKCSLKYKATDIKGEIKIKSDGTIESVTLTNNTNNTSITLGDNSTFTKGTITIKEGTVTKSSASTEEENTSRNSEDKITSGTIAIENGSITNGTINTTNDNITITDGKVENLTINSINITKGTIKDYSIFDNGKYMDNLIQCCNERKGDLLAIGNFTTSCMNNNNNDYTIRVDVWVNDEGEMLNNSTIYCNKIEKETKLTINVTFSGDKKK